MDKPIRILIVEDSENDTLLLLHELRRAGYTPIHRRVETADDMAAALQAGPWDVVTADHTMPHFNSTAALHLLQKWNRDIPFIVISGTIGEEAAVAAMRDGAHDYLIKGQLTRFVPAIEREIAAAAQRRRQRELEWTLLAQHEQLRIAHEIQQRLFPPAKLALENFEILNNKDKDPVVQFQNIIGNTPEDGQWSVSIKGISIKSDEEKGLLGAVSEISKEIVSTIKSK